MPITGNSTLSLEAAERRSASRNRFFSTEGLQTDLGKKSVRGGAITGTVQAMKFAVRFGSTAVLARILTPEDYGLVAMTAVITGFLGMFTDAGLTSATIQREQLNHEQVSTLFWVNATLGILITLLLIAISPAVAIFFKEPRVAGVTCALAVTFVFGGLTVQHQALLRRQMRFLALGIIEIASMTSGVLIAIVMAAMGYAYWSLVGLSFGTIITNMIGVWVAVPWIPGRPRRGVGTMPLLKFGSDIMRFNFVNFMSRHADVLLIGWYWGPVALGLYDKAYKLLLLPIRQINAPLAAVAFPALSRTKADPARFARFYLNGLQLVASISVPLIIGIAVFAEEVVVLWLGRTWLDCANLFRLLAAAALLGAVSNPIGWLLIASGETKKYRQIGFLTSVVIVTSFAVGLKYGAAGVAASYSLAMCLLFIPTWWFVVKGSPVGLRAVLMSLLPPFASAISAAAVAMGIRHGAGAVLPGGAAALIAAIGFGLTYLLVLLAGFNRWFFFARIIRDLRGSREKGLSSTKSARVANHTTRPQSDASSSKGV